MSKIKTTLYSVIPTLIIVGFVGYPEYKKLMSHRACDNAKANAEAAIEGCTWLISTGEGDLAAAYNNRGLAWRAAGAHDEARADFTLALDERKDPDIYRNRADTSNQLGDYKRALRDYQRGLALDANNAALLNNAAWFLATCPDKRFRDGKRAVKFAQRVTDIAPTPGRLGTLAAAYAEVGDFDKAIEMQRSALEIAPDDAIGLAALALFEAKKPYRAAPPK